MSAVPPSPADPRYRIGRSYTRARRFPWVIGKIQGWSIPFGPYTGTQLGVLIGGLWLVVQTYDLWRRLGAFGVVVLVLPPLATWAIRHAKIDGRSPIRAIGGYISMLAEPACGRIAGRVARDVRSVTLTGTIRLAGKPTAEPVPATAAAHSAATRGVRRPVAHAPLATPPPRRTEAPGPDRGQTVTGRRVSADMPERRATQPAAVPSAAEAPTRGAVRPGPTALQSLLTAVAAKPPEQ